MQNAAHQVRELSLTQRIALEHVQPHSVSGLTFAGRDIEQIAGGAFSPPLVSFVVINWNYARFVGAAIDSIRRQDYPYFECLVIDNGSTDESLRVIEKHLDGDQRFRVVSLPENFGQLGAACWALDKVAGGFVTFVDADDVLFCDYASIHVQTHMALPYPVAFTSSNTAEMDADGRALTSSYGHFGQKVTNSGNRLRDASHALRLPTVAPEAYDALAAKVTIIPRRASSWVWGPGTSNMFRTSVLRLVKIGDGHRPLMRSADGFFNFVCHALAGSALIDTKLSARRLHGDNYFAVRENFADLRSGTSAYARHSSESAADNIEPFLRNAEDFSWMLAGDYCQAIDQVSRAGPRRRRLRRFYRNRRVVAMFVEHAAVLRRALGSRRFFIQILARFPLLAASRIILSGMRPK
jgi:glycosyltransferase involved in cell wall biosynthesis